MNKFYIKKVSFVYINNSLRPEGSTSKCWGTFCKTPAGVIYFTTQSTYAKCKNDIGYLPTINDPTTRLAVWTPYNTKIAGEYYYYLGWNGLI